MSYSVSTLLISNLQDVFGENDPVRRRAAIYDIFNEDCMFHEPKGIYHGRDQIDRVAGKIKATHPDFRYQSIAGYRAALVKHRLKPGLISSSPAMAGVPPFISFSTSCRKHSNETVDKKLTKGGWLW
jgi:hypothetical protein